MSSDTNAKDTGRSLETTTSPSEEQPCTLAGTIPPSCQVCGRFLDDQGPTQQQLGPECADLSVTVLQVIVTEKHWTLEQIANLYSSTPENVMQKLHDLGMDVQEQQDIHTKSAAHTRKNSSGGIHRTKRNKTTHNPKDFNKNAISHPFVHNTTKSKSTTKTNTLALRYPNLVKEWHPTKNDRTPDQVTIGSNYKAWWQCLSNPEHEWPAIVKSRVKGRRCSYCTGNRVNKTNSLLTLRPDLAKEWHPTKNDRSPDQVTIGSNYKAWWQCLINLKHEWPARVSSRVHGCGCPSCSGRKADESSNLLIFRPDLAKEWHPTKNDRTPDQVKLTSTYKAWWQCSINPKHEWSARVCDRVHGCGCSSCSGRKVNETNNLLVLRPDLAKEWHPTKNDRTPDQVTIGSNYKAWWQCLINPEHEWPAIVKSRVKGTGCPTCNNTHVNEKWYPWEQFCAKLGRILYPSTFRVQPNTRLPNNKLPDFSYQNENNEFVIADAKTNCWITHIEDSISNYLPYCTRLEFWCLEKRRYSEIRDGKMIMFLTPEDLLTKILDERLQIELQAEVKKILEDVQFHMKSLGTFI